MALYVTDEPHWLGKKKEALATVERLIDTAKTAGRDFTHDERSRVERAMADAKVAQGELDRIDADRRFRESVNALTGGGPARHGGDYRGSGLKVAGRLDAAGFGDAFLAAARRDGRLGTKGLLGNGAIVIATPVVAELRPEGERPELVIDLLAAAPPNEGASHFRYLRQTARSSNAAPVAQGALKPTSAFTVASIEDRARTIAHVSEPIPRQELDDSEALRSFIATEMRNGVMVALDDQIVTGTGTGEALPGLLATSGTQAQAFDTSLFVTARRAITKLQIAGLTPTSWLRAEARRQLGRARILRPRMPRRGACHGEEGSALPYGATDERRRRLGPV